MRVTPRKNEVAAVEAILNDDTYEDGTTMAKAIVKAVVEELAKRDVYFATLGYNERPWIPVGPFYGQADVKAFMADMAGRGWNQTGYKVWAPQAFLDEYVEVDPNAPCECGHHRSLHHTGDTKPSDARGCGFPIPIKGRKTTNKKCPCSGFKPLRAAA